MFDGPFNFYNCRKAMYDDVPSYFMPFIVRISMNGT